MQLLLASLLALSCATTGGSGGGAPSNRTVTVNGATMSAEDRAKQLVDEGNAAALAKDDATARARFLEVHKDFADTTSYGVATVSLARIQLDGGQPKDAQQVLEKLLLDDPTTPVADDARYLLALAQLRQGDTRAAAPTLKSLVEKMPEEERSKAYRDLGSKLADEGHGTEAARYLSRALATASAADRPALEQKLIQVIDTEVPFADVRLLQETEAKDQQGLLDEVTTFKLARVHVHLHDYAAADIQVQRYLSRYPSGRWAKPANEMKVSLAARMNVDSKAIGVLLPLSGEYKAYGKRALAAIKIGFGASVKADAPPPEPVLDPATGMPAAPDPNAPPAPPPEMTKKAESLEETFKAPNGLRVIVRDTKGDAQLAQQLVRDLVEKERVIAVLGDILLDTSLPIALAAEEAGVPMISLSRRDGVPEAGPWSFRIALTAKKQADALVHLAVDGMGMKRFAIMYPKHAFGVEVMNAFWDALERREAEVTAVEAYAHDQTTFTAEAKSLVGRGIASSSEVSECRSEAEKITNEYRRRKAREGCGDLAKPIVDFEALFIPDSYRSVSYVIPALVAEDVLVTKDRRTVESYRNTTGNKSVRPVQLLGVNMWNDPELAKRLGRQIDGAILVDGFDAQDKTPRVEKFVQAFGAARLGRPALVEAQAHDGAALLSALLAPEAGSWNAGSPTPRTREGLRALIGGAKEFPGVTGLIKFDDQGDSATDPRFFVVDGDDLEARDLNKLVGEKDNG